ncbi:MAG TPA: WYL domain-containing protein [Nitriliruptoraceae bacterium]|nr:WYL domain-containing protein [Nitriliruptoraceae bacterium]
MRTQERSPEERLINLMVSLSASRAPRTFAQLRRDTVAYVQSDDESARRMFERDKDALRRMGVPIETVETGGVPGYRITRDDWVAHDIHLDRDEVAALAVGIALAGGQRERLALSRLTARAPDPDPGTSVPSMRMDVVDDGLDPVADAVARRATVRFGYRRADGGHMVRTVDAWGLVLRDGAAYLIGWDHDRGARRTFRLSRVTSRVTEVSVDEPRSLPPDFDAAGVLDEVHGDGTDIEVWVRAGAVDELEQRGGRVLEDRADDGWQRAVLSEADATRLRPWLLAAADRVVVTAPGWLRDEVTAALQALATSDTGGQA